MSRIRTAVIASLVILAAAACDDPAANAPPAASPSTSGAAPASASAVSPAPSSSAESPASVDPTPSAVASADVPALPASTDAPPALSGAAVAPSKPTARKGGPHTGILKGDEAEKILKKGSPTRVTLIDAGADPKSPMRYALATGSSTGIEMGLAMTLEVAQGDRTAPPQKIPRIATLLDLVSASAPKDGALGIDATIKKVSIAEDAGVPQQIADRLLPHLQSIQGLALHYEVTPEGRVKQAGAKMPGKKNAAVEGTLTQMTQSLESMIAPFPEEAVGLGARWEVVSRFDSSGTELVQWSTFELRERDDKGARLGLEVVQAAAHPEVTPPNLPPGVTAKLVEFASTGRGESSVDFAYPAPRKATMTVDSKMSLAVQQTGAPGANTSMKSTMVVDMKQVVGAAAEKKAPSKTP